MSNKKMVPGFYRTQVGEVFFYNGEFPEKPERTYFNILIYKMDGSTSQTFKESFYISTATPLNPKELIEHLRKKSSEIDSRINWINQKLSQLEQKSQDAQPAQTRPKCTNECPLPHTPGIYTDGQLYFEPENQ